MKGVRAFKLFNASERRFLEDVLRRSAQPWAAAWLLEDAAVQVRCLEGNEVLALAEQQRWLCCSLEQRGALFVPIAAGLEQSFAAATFGDVINNLGAASNGPSDVLGEVLSRALSDMARRLFEAAGNQAASMRAYPTVPSPSLWQRGSGAIAVALALHGEQLHIVLDAMCVASLLRARPREADRLLPLAQRSAGLGTQRTALRIWAGEATLEFGVLRSLARGDVVKLDTHVHAPMKISITGKTAPVVGYLGHIGDHKAVQLTAEKQP